MPGGGVVHAPLSWIAEFADLPATMPAAEIAAAMVRVGLEVERIEAPGEAITGPLVVGRVIEFAEEPQKNGKTIRWCSVDVGEAEPRGIVCGAANFAPGDLVVVALPGAVLPGGFEIAARKTYGHISDGMICSGRELAISDDHAGILILAPAAAELGTDARDDPGPGRDGPRDRGDAGPGLLPVDARPGPRGRDGAGRRLSRRRRSGRGATRGRPRLSGHHRRPVRLRPVQRAGRRRPRPTRAEPELGCSIACEPPACARSR